MLTGSSKDTPFSRKLASSRSPHRGNFHSKTFYSNSPTPIPVVVAAAAAITTTATTSIKSTMCERHSHRSISRCKSSRKASPADFIPQRIYLYFHSYPEYPRYYYRADNDNEEKKRNKQTHSERGTYYSDLIAGYNNNIGLGYKMYARARARVSSPIRSRIVKNRKELCLFSLRDLYIY